MQELQILKGHIGLVWNVSWNPEGNLLASCGEDKTIRIWAVESTNPFKLGLKTILTDAQEKTIRQICWSPCGNHLAAASFDATIAIWDVSDGFECTSTLEGHENEVKSVSWSKTGKYLATCSRDKTAWIWEKLEDDEFECAAVLNSHTQDVKKVLWNPNSDVLVSAGYDDIVNMYKYDAEQNDWICFCTLQSHQSTVWGLAFDKSGERLATCSSDQSVKIWRQYLPNNPEGIQSTNGGPTWKCVSTVAGNHGGYIYDISWSHLTDELIATACSDGNIVILKEDQGLDKNQSNFNILRSFSNAHAGEVNSVAWNPIIPNILASAGDDAIVKIWKIS